MTRNMGMLDRSLRAFLARPSGDHGGIDSRCGHGGWSDPPRDRGNMLATAATGFCPNYIWLGITTYPRGVHRDGSFRH